MDFFRRSGDVDFLDNLGIPYDESEHHLPGGDGERGRRAPPVSAGYTAHAMREIDDDADDAVLSGGLRSANAGAMEDTSHRTAQAADRPLQSSWPAAGAGASTAPFSSSHSTASPSREATTPRSLPPEELPELVTTEYNTYSLNQPPMTRMHTAEWGEDIQSGRRLDYFVHTRDNSLGFTFSGQPSDVVRFRSCIPSNLPRIRSGAVAQAPPEQTGPFTADIFCVVLLFMDASDTSDMLAISSVCRFWRYYANFAPHWTYFRRQEWIKRGDNVSEDIRSVLAKPKVMTREEFVLEKRRVEDYERLDRVLGTVKHVRWCVAIAIMAGAAITANYVMAYILGFLRTALRSDAKLGVTAAVLVSAMTLLEVIVVMIPLGGVSSPSNKDGMIRILSWGLVILDVSIVLGTISALAFTRVQATDHVLDGPTLDFSMGANCTVYPSEYYPSFVFLPALLWDMRWRPLTMDPTERVLEPFCQKKPGDDKDESLQCYVLLYFDAKYESAVFANKTMLVASKDVGTISALGFNPFEGGKPIQGSWCAASAHPQVIAVTNTTYVDIVKERDAAFPSDADWLVPRLRPQTYTSTSYRCSSNINREKTENPKGSTEMWYQYSPGWVWHYVPLLSNVQQVRATFQESHDHFLHYAFRCYIISAVLWGTHLLAQCIIKASAVDVLGATAMITLLVMNPFSLMVSGVLCIAVDNRNFMCNDSCGFGLIGAGIATLLVCGTTFVCFHQ